MESGDGDVGVGGGLEIEVDRLAGSTGTWLLNGETALIMVPSGRYARPSAWKPAAPVKPRSTTTSGTVPSTAAQSAGLNR